MGLLLLGPALRRVDGDTATVWVETRAPGTVSVDTSGRGGGSAKTFTVAGHHYAIVVVEGLPADAETPYTVAVDDEHAWPPAHYPYPAPTIVTRGTGAPVRLLFGSCREASPYAISGRFPPDALDTYALALAAGERPRPDHLILLGDQVYADEVSPRTRAFLRRRRRRRPGPEEEVSDFEEYTRLYLESWSDPEIRWLMSTVPSLMIFDDHEIIDDWNTSLSWRRRMAKKPWWHDRVASGLASYWIYQHLGNLSPAELAAEPLLASVHDTADAADALHDFGLAADAEADGGPGYRWSHRIDIGRTRIVMLDTRCSRVLDPARRAMLPDREWDWFVDQVHGDYDHLVVGVSLPWLLPPAIHDVEAWDERLCESAHAPVARFGEWLRQVADMEHWAAFRRSFAAMADVLGDVARGRYGTPPASISVLSGDVHHSYVARAALAGTTSPVYQLTCSPIHNQAPHAMQAGFRFGWSRAAHAIGATLARSAGVPARAFTWDKLAGPTFSNSLGMLELSGRQARAALLGTERDPDRRPRLVTRADVPLTSSP